jgi:hypothetical protein
VFTLPPSRRVSAASAAFRQVIFPVQRGMEMLLLLALTLAMVHAQPYCVTPDGGSHWFLKTGGVRGDDRWDGGEFEREFHARVLFTPGRGHFAHRGAEAGRPQREVRSLCLCLCLCFCLCLVHFTLLRSCGALLPPPSPSLPPGQLCRDAAPPVRTTAIGEAASLIVWQFRVAGTARQETTTSAAPRCSWGPATACRSQRPCFADA